MHTIIAALVLLPITAGAADFRVLDFGGACANVKDLEVAEGSTPIPWKQIEGGELHAFEGRAFDRQVTIVYFCINGKLFTGNYFLPSEPLDVATESYRLIYEELNSTYGMPFLDNTPWQHGAAEKIPEIISPDPSRYYVTWRNTEWSVTTILTRDEGAPVSTRHVRVLVSSLKACCGI